MPRKYIKIRQLHARVPFRQCVIQFVVRKQEKDPVTALEIEFYAQAISYTLEENVELLYSQKYLNSLAIYLMAINPQNRVASIGFVSLRLGENFTDRKDKLVGLNQQTGYIVFSMQDEPFTRMSHLLNVNISSSSAHSSEGKEQPHSHLVKEKLEIKRSQFEQEDEEQQDLKVSKVQEYRTDRREKEKEKEKEKCLLISKKEQQLGGQRLQDSPIKTILTQNCPILNQKQFSEQIAKSDLAEQLDQIDDIQNLPIIPPSHLSLSLPLSEHQQLQAFLIELLKHKLKNSQYLQTIKHNSLFLEQQRARLSNILMKKDRN